MMCDMATNLALDDRLLNFLLCAVAERRAMPILTADEDFRRFATVIPIALHKPRRR